MTPDTVALLILVLVIFGGFYLLRRFDTHQSDPVCAKQYDGEVRDDDKEESENEDEEEESSTDKAADKPEEDEDEPNDEQVGTNTNKTWIPSRLVRFVCSVAADLHPKDSCSTHVFCDQSEWCPLQCVL
jgi:Mg-chelatase subunit ChlI